MYIVLRWFVVGLSAMGLLSMRLGFANTSRYGFCTFVKAVQPTPTMNTRSLSATIVRDCSEGALNGTSCWARVCMLPQTAVHKLKIPQQTRSLISQLFLSVIITLSENKTASRGSIFASKNGSLALRTFSPVSFSTNFITHVRRPLILLQCICLVKSHQNLEVGMTGIISG